MKRLILCLIAAMAFVYFAEVQAMNHFRPSTVSLSRTSSSTGALLMTTSRGHKTPQLNGIPLMCGASYLGPTDDCTNHAKGLIPGAMITVAFADVHTLTYPSHVAMSIAVSGKQVYAASPEQVIDGYVASSRSFLFSGPALVLIIGLVIAIQREEFLNLVSRKNK